MGIAYLGHRDRRRPRAAARPTRSRRRSAGAARCGALGLLMIVLALPAAFFVQRAAGAHAAGPAAAARAARRCARARCPAARLLPARARQHGLDRRRRRHDAEPEAVSEPRPRAAAGRRSRSVLSLILVGSIVGRLLMGWLADRWPKKHVMLLIYAIVAATIPLAVPSPRRPAALRSAPSSSASAWAATT